VTALPCPAWLPSPEPHPALRVLVANPHARGVDRAAVERIAELLGLEDGAIREVGRDGSTRALAAEAVRAGAACVIAAGGDGTVHEVVQEVAGSPSALGVIPLGTSNDLATRAGIPRDIEAACALARHGAVGTLDVLTLGDRRIATVGGFGFPAWVAASCNALRRGRVRPLAQLLGRGVYTAVAATRILADGARAAPLALRLDRGSPTVLPASAVLFGVAGRFGGGITLFPEGSVTPGTFAALIVTAGSRAGLLATLLRLRAGRPAGRLSRLVTGLTSLDLRTAGPIGAFGDGEWLGFRRRATVVIERDALRVIVPRDDAPVRLPHPAPGEAR
jgi:diacylglycerol kinase (ATP)